MADDATPTATLADEFFAALEHVAKQRRALRELKGIGPIDLVVCDRGAIDPKVGFPSGVVFSDDPQAKPLMDSLLHCESAAARVFARHPREKEDFESWLKRTGDELAMEARGTFADSPYEKPSVQYKRELAAWRKRLSGEPRPPVPQIPHWEGAYPDDGIRSTGDVAAYLKSELNWIVLLEPAQDELSGQRIAACDARAAERALKALSNADFTFKHFGATGYPNCRLRRWRRGLSLPNLKARILDVIAWASDPVRLAHGEQDYLPGGAEITPHDLDERAQGERNAVWAASMCPVVRDWRLVQREPLPERGQKNLSLNAHYPEWPHIKHLAREKFNHVDFSEDTLAELFTFLQGTLGISSNEAWELPRGQVASLLRGDDDNVTLKEFAKLVYRSAKTLKQGYGTLPSPTKASRGPNAAEFSYRVLREWAIKNDIQTAGTLPNSLAEALANFARANVHLE